MTDNEGMTEDPDTQVIDLAEGADEQPSSKSTLRSLRADETILPAENWCPSFVYYSGTSSPKYNDSQIEALCRQSALSGWCNLCDGPLRENSEKHVRAHMKQLAAWRKARGAIVDKERAARLAEARRERKRQADAGISVAPRKSRRRK